MRANAMICLINQANFLLDQQVAAVEKQFVENGGYSERLAVARLAERDRQRKRIRPDQSNQTDSTDLIPPCPHGSKLMVLRTARSGNNNVGQQFWG